MKNDSFFSFVNFAGTHEIQDCQHLLKILNVIALKSLFQIVSKFIYVNFVISVLFIYLLFCVQGLFQSVNYCLYSLDNCKTILQCGLPVFVCQKYVISRSSRRIILHLSNLNENQKCHISWSKSLVYKNEAAGIKLQRDAFSQSARWNISSSYTCNNV